MGNLLCCCKDDKEPEINVRVHDVICCDNIECISSCCIKPPKKHHHHHKHHEKPIEIPIS